MAESIEKAETKEDDKIDSVAEFIRELSTNTRAKRTKDLSLYEKKAYFQRLDSSSVITTSNPRVRTSKKLLSFDDDGLYSSSGSPLTTKVVKPYPLEHQISFCKHDGNNLRSGKLLEIAIREVSILANQGKQPPQVTSVGLLYKDKVICRTNKPFNRKLHKLYIRNQSDSNNLQIQVQAQGGLSSTLPLPLPERSVKHKKVGIEFSIDDFNGGIYSGVVVCTISLNFAGSKLKQEPSTYLYTPSTNDPNDPRNSFSLVKLRDDGNQKKVRYFSLQDPALCFSTLSPDEFKKQFPVKKRISNPPDMVVAEETSSLWDITFGKWFEEEQPLVPSTAMTQAPKHHAGRKQILTVTILRGVEVPVREESALVNPIIEVEWENITRCTAPSNGPAPVWHQTLEFEYPTLRVSGEHCIKLRLFDVHPAWGLQWLGEARIPVVCHQNYQQLERWVGLSPVYSPTLSFGYVQAAPGFSYTRLYVLVKMEHMGSANPIDDSSVNKLCKAVQRCLAVPYKLAEIETTDDAQKLVMLLDSLPLHYGPLTPRQALNLNKVDHFGRSALLATLLQGLGLTPYVLLGSSQIRLWDSYVITIDEKSRILMWDAANGDHFELDESRCPLISVSRMINSQNIWDNPDKTAAPITLDYNPKSSGDWDLIISHSSASGIRNVQPVDLNIVAENDDEEKHVKQEIEETLRENLARWRTTLELTTVFNRHADSILREILEKTDDSAEAARDRKDLRQLYRAYYTHGFIVNVRYTDVKDISNFLQSTKTHAMTGPIEFGLVCHVKKLVGKIRSVWLAVVILRSKS